MRTNANLQRAIDLRQIPVPAGFNIVSIEAEDYTDWDGDPALRISVVIDENMDVDHISGEVINTFKRSVRDSLIKHGVTLFPFFRFAKPSELASTDGD